MSEWERKSSRVGRFCDLVFLIESDSSTRSSLLRRGFIRGIPRFLCQNSLLAAYYLRDSISFLASFHKVELLWRFSLARARLGSA